MHDIEQPCDQLSPGLCVPGVQSTRFAYHSIEHRIERCSKAKKQRTYLTILSSLLNSFSRLISLIEVLGTPSSSASNRIFLSATKVLVRISLALYTTPYVPLDQLHRLYGLFAYSEMIWQLITHPPQPSPSWYSSPTTWWPLDAIGFCAPLDMSVHRSVEAPWRYDYAK